MNRLSLLTLTTMALLFLGVALTPGDVVGQEKTLKEQLVGTWTYVSVDTVNPDGSRVPMYGPNPQGLAVFDSNGHYILLTAHWPAKIRVQQSHGGYFGRIQGRRARNDSSLRQIHRQRDG